MAKANTDVATATNNLPAEFMEEMEGDKGHRQSFDVAQMMIPRITVLQDLSDEVKERNPEYVPGAKPGLIFNTLNKQIDTMIQFVPSKFVVRYIAWRPRKDGGGLVSQSLTLEDVEATMDPAGIGQWTGMMAPRPGEPQVAVEVNETPEWVGMARGKDWDWMPVAISFGGTKSKVARWINTTIDLTKEQGKDGPFTPAPFFHQFSFRTGLEQKGDDEWYGYVAEHNGYCPDGHIRKEAKQLKLSMDRGEVDFENVSASEKR